MFYVHTGGIVTHGYFLGSCTGGEVIQLSVFIYLLAVIVFLIIEQIKEQKKNLYQYRNVRRLGAIIFLIPMLSDQVFMLINIVLGNGLIYNIHSIISSVETFTFFAFPVAFILSLLITISNIQLLIKEGRTFRNLLGTALGLLICIGSFLPSLSGQFLNKISSGIMEVSDLVLYVYMAFTTISYMVITYLECVLIGSIVMSLKAAKRVPAFDKDYILILGCQINKDGTLTKLLQGRADRAVWFANKQKEKTGKDIIFVPTGGQGSDEIISEGEAIKNYLMSIGIEESRILAETDSVSTYENMKNSVKIINEHFDIDDPKIAFSTTNYHVFRSGVIASTQGIKTEGIGSKTKRYFWINAFIREFIAAVYYERKKHIALISLFALNIIGMILVIYLSNTV